LKQSLCPSVCDQINKQTKSEKKKKAAREIKKTNKKSNWGGFLMWPFKSEQYKPRISFAGLKKHGMRECGKNYTDRQTDGTQYNN